MAHFKDRIQFGFSMCRVILLLICVILSSCTKTEDTTIYVPPAAEGARICTNQCHLAQDYCDEACDGTYRKCVDYAQQQALIDYDKYSHDQLVAKQTLDLEYSDFVRLQPCNVKQKSCYNTCESTFGMCYTRCGGKKEIINSCQYLCF